jgi:hypothetical protein
VKETVSKHPIRKGPSFSKNCRGAGVGKVDADDDDDDSDISNTNTNTNTNNNIDFSTRDMLFTHGLLLFDKGIANSNTAQGRDVCLSVLLGFV